MKQQYHQNKTFCSNIKRKMTKSGTIYVPYLLTVVNPDGSSYTFRVGSNTVVTETIVDSSGTVTQEFIILIYSLETNGRFCSKVNQ